MDNLPRPAAILAALITAALGIAWGLAEFGIFTPLPAEIYEPILTVFTPITVLIGIFALSVNQASDEKQQRSNREILIDIVHHNWIEGVLHDALRDAEIQLEFEGTPEKAGDARLYVDYELPIDLVLNDGNTRENLRRTSDVLLTTFKQVDRKLLILGAPGSGKTVLMLQLAEKLLEDARKGKPIPVMFNLSSWAEKRASLTDWLIEQLGRDYGAGKKIAAELIQSDSLIYLLDGFDEVAEAHREECLSKLNTFISPIRQVVICSRINEYAAIAQPLNTKFAIEIQELSDEQFGDELRNYIPKAETTEAIIKTLQTDNEVWQEVKKPLFINILINTYADGKPFSEHLIEGTTIEKLQVLVIEPYITRQLQNKQKNEGFDNALIPRYLAWISDNLQEKSESVFYVEMLQVDWLPLNSSRLFLYLLRLNLGLFIGLLTGGVVALTEGLEFGLFLGLIFGITIGTFSNVNRINLQQRIFYNHRKLIFGIVIGIITLFKSVWKGFLFFAFLFGISSAINRGIINGLFNGFQVTMYMFLVFGLSFGIFVGLYGPSAPTNRSIINQGFRETLQLGLLLGVIGTVILSFFLSWGSIVIYWLFATLLGGMDDAAKHLILRLDLYRRKLAPRRFDKFLEHVIERRIMRRVGGSAIFIHRYILEYFADEWERRYASEFAD